ncbi:MAG: hypothetical protein ACREP5_02600, partial [Candidatus Binatia bacterium]
MAANAERKNGLQKRNAPSYDASQAIYEVGKAMRHWLKLLALSSLLLPSLAWGHGEHETDGLQGIAPLWVWLVGGALLSVVSLILVRQAKKGRLIGARFRGFSRNA